MSKSGKKSSRVDVLHRSICTGHVIPFWPSDTLLVKRDIAIHTGFMIFKQQATMLVCLLVERYSTPVSLALLVLLVH